MAKDERNWVTENKTIFVNTKEGNPINTVDEDDDGDWTLCAEV